MKNEFHRYVTRVAIGITLLLFVGIYFLMIKPGISSVEHLFSFIIASYLVLWGWLFTDFSSS